MINKEYYIRKWLDGSLTEEEFKIFQSFDDYEELERISSSVKSFKAPAYDVTQELGKLKNKSTGNGKVVQMPLLKSWRSVAAAVIILFTSFFYFYLNNKSLTHANVGEHRSVYLPDSSLIELNASSTITYKQRIWRINRNVQLQGEAFFDVAKGSIFNVITEDGIISVLGTEFNVKSRSEYFEVVCYEGQVSVKSDLKTEVLYPGESIRIIAGEYTKKENLAVLKPTWIIGESVFESTPYSEVLAELERQYGVSIDISGIDLRKRYTGRFLHKNIDLALQAITIPFDLEYRIINDQEVAIKTLRD